MALWREGPGPFFCSDPTACANRVQWDAVLAEAAHNAKQEARRQLRKELARQAETQRRALGKGS
jgi:hypothetical protein